jgi:flavin-dependent dehydrogenase
MRIEVPGGPRVRLTYGDDGSHSRSAAGFDRSTLDPTLLSLATQAGARLRTGATVAGGELGRDPWLAIRDVDGTTRLRARLVVGADGIRSTVARLAGVARRGRMDDRIGLTFHLADQRHGSAPHDARMIILDRAYCGLAPVPGGRVNVGIVLAGPRWRTQLGADGAAAVVARILGAVPAAPDDPVAWADAAPCDAIEGAAPLSHRVGRRAGDGWLLVGDAAGFLDPFTGEGLHRALVSAEIAAAAIHARLLGQTRSFQAYEHQMQRRFGAKDLVSQIVMAFLERPTLFAYAARRLARRPRVRETMGLVMGDLVPASRALDPRFLAALVRP